MKTLTSVLLLVALAACSGGNSGTPIVPSAAGPTGAIPSFRIWKSYHATGVWVVNEPSTYGSPDTFAAYDAHAQYIVGPAPSSTQVTPLAYKYVNTGFMRDRWNNFVYTNAANAIVTCSASPAGNCVPVATVVGSATGLNDPRGISENSSGRLAVANLQSNDVLIFELGANGNVAPLSTIAGSNTGISQPMAVAFDQSDNLWVADYGELLEFAAGANGNVAPIRTIVGNQTGLGATTAIAVDRQNVVYTVDEYTNRLAAFDESTLGSNVSPDRVWSNPNVSGISTPNGVAVDDYNVYVANYGNNSISILDKSPSAPNSFFGWITGAGTGLNHPYGVALQ